MLLRKAVRQQVVADSYKTKQDKLLFRITVRQQVAADSQQTNVTSDNCPATGGGGQLLKQELERVYGILEWSPTNVQLLRIAKFIQENPDNLQLVSGYICEICTVGDLYVTEGVDNSDLNYLIALATKAVNEAD